MGFFRRSRREAEPSGRVTRLHIGAGQESIPGWINIDNQGHPGVDQVLDVRRGLPFSNVAAIYAEHFIEHLTLDDGLAFLKECRRVLASDGVLRLSTPNLDWVCAHPLSVTDRPGGGRAGRLLPAEPCLPCVGTPVPLQPRDALRGRPLRGLRLDGPFRTYGESQRPELTGLERHQTWEDTPELPHVLIIEASGSARGAGLDEKELREFREAMGAR